MEEVPMSGKSSGIPPIIYLLLVVLLGGSGWWVVRQSDFEPIAVLSWLAGDPLFQADQTLTGHDDIVQSVSISPDGNTLVSGSDDNTIKIWDLATGQLRQTLGHDDIVQSVSISPDGSTLVSGSADRTIKIWRVTP
jgi:WD40 repeat protein